MRTTGHSLLFASTRLDCFLSLSLSLCVSLCVSVCLCVSRWFLKACLQLTFKWDDCSYTHCMKLRTSYSHINVRVLLNATSRLIMETWSVDGVVLETDGCLHARRATRRKKQRQRKPTDRQRAQARGGLGQSAAWLVGWLMKMKVVSTRAAATPMSPSPTAVAIASSPLALALSGPASSRGGGGGGGGGGARSVPFMNAGGYAESALSPLGAAGTLNALSQRLQKDARSFQERIATTTKAGSSVRNGNDKGKGEFSFWTDGKGGTERSGGRHAALSNGQRVADEGSLRRGLETSLAATAALMEACEGARGAMDAIQRESQGLVTGVEAQVSLMHKDLMEKWQQHEADVAGIAEDVTDTLEAAMATIAARDKRIIELEDELTKERNTLQIMRGEKAAEQAKEIECVRMAMKVSEEREAEAKRLREEVKSMQAEIDRLKLISAPLTIVGEHDASSSQQQAPPPRTSREPSVSLDMSGAGLRAELDDTRRMLDRVSGAASHMVISELRERSLSASIQQQQKLQLQEQEQQQLNRMETVVDAAPPAITEVHRARIMSAGNITSASSSAAGFPTEPSQATGFGYGIRSEQDDALRADGEPATAAAAAAADDDVNETSDLLAKLEESKAKRAAAVSKARSINRRRSVSLSQAPTLRRKTVA